MMPLQEGTEHQFCFDSSSKQRNPSPRSLRGLLFSFNTPTSSVSSRSQKRNELPPDPSQQGSNITGSIESFWFFSRVSFCLFLHWLDCQAFSSSDEIHGAVHHLPTTEILAQIILITLVPYLIFSECFYFTQAVFASSHPGHVKGTGSSRLSSCPCFLASRSGLFSLSITTANITLVVTSHILRQRIDLSRRILPCNSG